MRTLVSSLFLLFLVLPIHAYTDVELSPISASNLEQLVPLDMPAFGITGDVTAISHDGTKLATQTDETIMLWDLQTGELLFELPFLSYNRWSSIVFSPDDSSIAIARNALYVVDLQSYEIRLFRGDSVHDVAISPDGRLIASAAGLIESGGSPYMPSQTYLNTVRIQDLETGQLLVDIYREEANYGGFSGVAFSPNGEMLAAAASSAIVYLWNTQDLLNHQQEPLGMTQVDTQTGDVTFSPDNTTLTVSYALLHNGGDGYATLNTYSHASSLRVEDIIGNMAWDVSVPYSAHFSYWWGANALFYNDDGSLLGLFGQAAFTSLWNAETGEELQRFEVDSSLIFTEDSKMLITFGDEHGLGFWGIPN